MEFHRFRITERKDIPEDGIASVGTGIYSLVLTIGNVEMTERNSDALFALFSKMQCTSYSHKLFVYFAYCKAINTSLEKSCQLEIGIEYV